MPLARHNGSRKQQKEKVASGSRRWPGRRGLPKAPPGFYWGKKLITANNPAVGGKSECSRVLATVRGMGVSPPKRRRNDLRSLNTAPGLMGTRIGNYTSPTITPNPYPLCSHPLVFSKKRWL